MTLTSQPVEDKVVVLQHDSAVEFLAVAFPTLQLHEHSASIVLAPALMRAPAEFVLTECQFIMDTDIQLPLSSTQPTPANNFWLTVWSQDAKSRPVLHMVLSCLDSSFGDYPIFLWTPAAQLPRRRMDDVAAYLLACVAPERVFSVFGSADLVTDFANVWTELTGFQINPKPLYKAFSALCTPQSLKASVSHERCVARRATVRDIEAAGRLCQEFANSSVCGGFLGPETF
jgi:hypothetical protein